MVIHVEMDNNTSVNQQRRWDYQPMPVSSNWINIG